MSENSLLSIIPQRNNAVLAYRTFEDQVAIVDLAHGTLNLLNPTATRIWQLIGEGKTPKDIAKEVSREFEASFHEVVDDIIGTLQEMALRNWIDGFPSAENSRTVTNSDGTEIFEALREKAVQKQIPLVAHVDLTYRCNLQCVHCYLTNGKKELECSTEEIKDILEQLANAGTLYLTLSGGEIFLRRDLPEIVRHARKLHFAVRLLTSGTLIRDEMVDEIAEWHPELIAFSVYDLNPLVHDAITKRKGSLEKTLKIIDALKEKGVPIKISSVLMQSNIRWLSPTIQFC
jgi:sulfatase maturation enzyme AslB (radical SAM superfamily)